MKIKKFVENRVLGQGYNNEMVDRVLSEIEKAGESRNSEIAGRRNLVTKALRSFDL